METVIRIVVLYIFLLFGVRVLGKRELGQLSPFEFVTLLLIPELVQQSAVREDFSITNALVAVSTLFCLVFLNSLLSYRWKWFRRATEGEPIVLVYDGRLLTENMDRERIPADEIFSEMRKSGVERLEDVKWAIIEPDGKIGIVRNLSTAGVQRPEEKREPA